MVYLKILILLVLTMFFSCQKKEIRFVLTSNGQFVFEILPQDILFYDTTDSRGQLEIHEIRLRDDFFKKDSLFLVYPIELFCEIGGKDYFWSDYWFQAQSEPLYNIHFHFDPECDNKWAFSEIGSKKPSPGDNIIFVTKNKCNSFELFHRSNEIERNREYYEKRESFRNYIKSERLAHQALFDPFYLKSLNESGILIK